MTYTRIFYRTFHGRYAASFYPLNYEIDLKTLNFFADSQGIYNINVSFYSL